MSSSGDFRGDNTDFTPAHARRVIIISHYSLSHNCEDSCGRGDIRLWGGNNQYEGNIELCTDQGIWSTVSDVTWESEDAVVACRQLGYTNSSKAHFVASHIIIVLY